MPTSTTPKAKAAPTNPSSSKAAKAKDSVKPILVASMEEKQAQTATENEDSTKDQFRDTIVIRQLRDKAKEPGTKPVPLDP